MARKSYPSYVGWPESLTAQEVPSAPLATPTPARAERRSEARDLGEAARGLGSFVWIQGIYLVPLVAFLGRY